MGSLIHSFFGYGNSIVINPIGKPKNGFPNLNVLRFNERKSLRYENGSFFPCCCSQSEGNADEEKYSLQELRVPIHWAQPSKALQEAEWLRVELHKWLDEEYCPEATNEVISKIAAESYYKSLVEKKFDVGDILLTMAVDLESISYRDSFHGAFSSANAAVNLIIQRMLHQ